MSYPYFDHPLSNVITDLTYKTDVPDNCEFFPERQVSNSQSQSIVVPGICANVENFFDNRGLTADRRITLTWDPDDSRQSSRRRAACPALKGLQGEGGGYCSVQNQAITNHLGISSNTEVVSCDEFPIASTEEGGKFSPQATNKPNSNVCQVRARISAKSARQLSQ